MQRQYHVGGDAQLSNNIRSDNICSGNRIARVLMCGSRSLLAVFKDAHHVAK